MKYWYDDADCDKAIKLYMIEDNKIIVFYFNGEVSIMKYREDIERELIGEMISQAEKRDSEVSIEYLKYNNLISDIKLFSTISLGIFGCISANIESMNNSVRFVGGCMSVVSALLAFLEEKKNTTFSKQIEELEKYKLYLNMRKELEDNFNEQTFRGIKLFDGKFDINTLDHYSLGEIKKIKKNLDKNK